jgi:hypothetical protein
MANFSPGHSCTVCNLAAKLLNPPNWGQLLSFHDAPQLTGRLLLPMVGYYFPCSLECLTHVATDLVV